MNRFLTFIALLLSVCLGGGILYILTVVFGWCLNKIKDPEGFVFGVFAAVVIFIVIVVCWVKSGEVDKKP